MNCRRANDNVASLLDMPSGCKLRVEELTGSPAMRSRLYALGILPGTEMELCGRACGKGGVCVRVRQSSLVLGECMARSISCCAADDGERGRRRRRMGLGRRGRRGRPDCPGGANECFDGCRESGGPDAEDDAAKLL